MNLLTSRRRAVSSTHAPKLFAMALCAALAAMMFSVAAANAGVNSWSATGGPQGANIVDLEPIDSGVLAATLYDGVYYSIDAGNSWAKFGSGFSPAVLWTRDVAVSDTATFFAATNNGIYQVRGVGGLWEPAGSGTLGQEMVSVVVAADGTVIAGGNSPGVDRSTDGGATWNPATVDVPDTVWCLEATDTTVVAGTYGDGVWVSGDEGENWERAGTGIPAGTQVNNVSLGGSAWFAATSQGLYRSTDTGNTWVLVGYNTHTDVAVEVGGAVVAAEWNAGINRSTDGGDTWTPIVDSNPSRWPDSLATIGYTVLAGYRGPGVYRTTSAGTAPWVASNTGFPLLASRCAAYGPGGAMFVSAETADGTSAGLLKSTDGGTTWRATHPALVGNTVFDLATSPSSSLSTLTAAGSAGVWQTADGNTWTEVTGVLPGTPTAIAVSANGSKLVVAGDGWVSTRNTGDAVWTPVVTTGLPVGWINSALITTNGSLLLGKGDAAYRLPFGGAVWSAVPDFSGAIYELTQRTDGRIYAAGSMSGTTTAVFKSADNGATWTPLPGTGNDVRTLAVFPYGNFIFACTRNNAVRRSTDDGASWQQAGATIPGATHMAAAASFGPLMVGTTAGVRTYEFVPPQIYLSLSPSDPAEVDGWYKGPRTIVLYRPVSAATYYRIDEGSTETTLATTVVFPAVEGSHTINYFGTTWGTAWTAPATIIRVDSTAPSGTMKLQGGLAQTSKRIGTLDSLVSDPGDGAGLTEMRVQVGGVWGAWGPYANTTIVTLPGWDGTKLVQAEYRDKVGNVFSASDTIYYKRPRAVLSTPRLSVTSPRRGVYFACAGTVTPRVYGSDKVRVYRKNSLGRWVAYGTYSAANSKYGTGSKYRGVLRIAKRGSYRMRVYYPGSSTVASNSSAWRYFTVK